MRASCVRLRASVVRCCASVCVRVSVCVMSESERAVCRAGVRWRGGRDARVCVACVVPCVLREHA